MSELRIRRRSEIVRREVGNEVLLFDPRDDSLHVLNATAAVLWERLDGVRSLAELTAHLRDSFAVDAEADVEADVRRIVRELRQRDLVIEAEP